MASDSFFQSSGIKSQPLYLRKCLKSFLGESLTNRIKQILKPDFQQKADGIPEKNDSRRDYWEWRAVTLFEKDRAILDPSDPYAKAQAEFLAELDRLKWGSMLDVGCGYGRLLYDLTRYYPERKVIGVDFSFNQLKHGIEYLPPPVPLIQACAHHLPFLERSVDAIVTVAMLIYVHPRELANVLTEFKRVSRRYIIAIEYAREHMRTPLRRRLMKNAPWFGHDYRTAFATSGIRILRSYSFHAFDDQPNRVPLSLVLGEIRV